MPTTSDRENAARQAVSPASQRELLLEQIGTSNQINRTTLFYIALLDGESEGTVNPLPDIDE